MIGFRFYIREGTRRWEVEMPDGPFKIDMNTARRMAVEALSGALQTAGRAGDRASSRSIEIEDDAGTVLATVSRRDVFRLH